MEISNTIAQTSSQHAASSMAYQWELTIVVLGSVRQRPGSCASTIMQHIHHYSGGECSPPWDVIVRTLSDLGEAGHIRAIPDANANRFLYDITDSGLALIKQALAHHRTAKQFLCKKPRSAK